MNPDPARSVSMREPLALAAEVDRLVALTRGGWSATRVRLALMCLGLQTIDRGWDLGRLLDEFDAALRGQGVLPDPEDHA